MTTRFKIGAEEWPGISKLVEESGEVLQVCGKLVANDGQEEHWDGTNLRRCLIKELADLQAAIDFVCDFNGINRGASAHEFEQLRSAKLKIFRQWHRDTFEADHQ